MVKVVADRADQPSVPISTDTFGGSLLIFVLLFPFWVPAVFLWFVGVRARTIGRPAKRGVSAAGVVARHEKVPVWGATTADVAVIAYSTPDGQPRTLVEGRRRGGKLVGVGDEVEISYDAADPTATKTCDRRRLRLGRIAGVLSGLYLLLWALMFWRLLAPAAGVVGVVDLVLRFTTGRSLGQQLAYRPLPAAAARELAATVSAPSAEVLDQARWIGRARRAGAWDRRFGWLVAALSLIGLTGMSGEAGPMLPLGLVFVACGVRLVQMGLPEPFGIRTVEVKTSGPWGDPSGDAAHLVVVEHHATHGAVVHAERIVGSSTAALERD